ncbi:MAG TPA: hypothetical protein VFU25_11700, partial [Ornithinibacter sp.]|nr:hypothetical protein [Ornithinibacter sp.]
RALLELLGDDVALGRAARAAHTLGTQYTWPAVGREMLKLLARASEVHEQPARRHAAAIGTPPLPPLDHLERLVDRGGIVQHAVGLEPDRSTGYCVDDVARLLLVADALAARAAACPQLGAMAERSLAFLEEAWAPRSGSMHNLRDVGGTWLDEPHHGDHVGRTVWALGEVAGRPSPLALRSRSLLDAVVAAWPADAPPRAVAFAVLGLARSSARPADAGVGPLRALADELSGHYRRHRRPEWAWFEDELTYDNARLPQALLAAAGPLHDAGLLAEGLESLDWYAQSCALGSGVVVLVGNRWRRRSANPTGRPPAEGDRGTEGDEQPLDAAALVEACVEAYRSPGAPSWGQHALEAYGWFSGANRWRTPVYDDLTGGCHDGVGPGGLNLNEGAESTLAHVQAWVALDDAGLGPGRHRA